MPTAAENSVLPAGLATLEVSLVAGKSAVTSAFAASPMKLLAPVARGPSVWACTSSFGGGLVAGDQTRLEMRLGKNARCFLGTQASTKIYRNPGLRACGHVSTVMLEENSFLVFAPDPIQPFAHSSYAQRQEFRLAPGAGLVLVDWFSSGRAARGEHWAFHRFQSRNDVFLAGERIFVDSISLDATAGWLPSPHVTGGFECFAMLLMVGEPVQKAAVDLLAECSKLPVQRGAKLIASASPVPQGAVLRVAGEGPEGVGRELHRQLKFATALLGDDPWARKW
jgi:urease accessory protein